jgi:hypothetical protein
VDYARDQKACGVPEQAYMKWINMYLTIFTNLTVPEVLTVMDIESQFNEKLITLEPSVHDKSCGPMQVRIKTARGLGLKGDWHQLCTWQIGLYYGMKYLSQSKKRALHSTHNSLVARKRTWAGYNAGNYYLIRLATGEWTYLNNGYVKKCEHVYVKYANAKAKAKGKVQLADTTAFQVVIKS